MAGLGVVTSKPVFVLSRAPPLRFHTPEGFPPVRALTRSEDLQDPPEAGAGCMGTLKMTVSGSKGISEPKPETGVL